MAKLDKGRGGKMAQKWVDINCERSQTVRLKFDLSIYLSVCLHHFFFYTQNSQNYKIFDYSILRQLKLATVLKSLFKS